MATFESQSFIHQGVISQDIIKQINEGSARKESQSFIHQGVISQYYVHLHPKGHALRRRRNPLFIKGLSLRLIRRLGEIFAPLGRNPLFIKGLSLSRLPGLCGPRKNKSQSFIHQGVISQWTLNSVYIQPATKVAILYSSRGYLSGGKNITNCFLL